MAGGTDDTESCLDILAPPASDSAIKTNTITDLVSGLAYLFFSFGCWRHIRNI